MPDKLRLHALLTLKHDFENSGAPLELGDHA